MHSGHSCLQDSNYIYIYASQAENIKTFFFTITHSRSRSLSFTVFANNNSNYSRLLLLFFDIVIFAPILISAAYRHIGTKMRISVSFFLLPILPIYSLGNAK